MADTATQTDKDRFLWVYENEHQRTMRVLNNYPPDKADYKPAPNLKTARELAWIFAMEPKLGRVKLMMIFPACTSFRARLGASSTETSRHVASPDVGLTSLISMYLNVADPYNSGRHTSPDSSTNAPSSVASIAFIWFAIP